MRLGFVAALVLATIATTCLPIAAAQAPDPSSVVAEACAAVGGLDPQARDLIPLCPREEPAGPSPAAAEEQAAAPPPPATPQDVPQLAAEVLEDARKIPQDPASAPERVLSIVATIVQFVKDLLELPGKVGDAIGEGLATIGGKLTEGASAVQDATARAVAAVKDLLTLPAREPAAPAVPKVEAPRVAPVADRLLGSVDALL